MQKPLLVTDNKYIWIHHFGSVIGPFNAHLIGDQLDERANYRDPNGCPLNPEGCFGGKVHTVENPMSPPQELVDAWKADTEV